MDISLPKRCQFSLTHYNLNNLRMRAERRPELTRIPQMKFLAFLEEEWPYSNLGKRKVIRESKGQATREIPFYFGKASL